MLNSKPITRLSNSRSRSRPKQRSTSKNSAAMPSTTKYKALEDKLKKVNKEKNEVITKYNSLLLNQAIPTGL